MHIFKPKKRKWQDQWNLKSSNHNFSIKASLKVVQEPIECANSSNNERWSEGGGRWKGKQQLTYLARESTETEADMCVSSRKGRQT